MTGDWKDILSKMNVDADSPADEPSAVAETSPSAPRQRSVTLFFERKGRAGKSATILSDFSGVDDNEIARLASELKQALGTGGSARGGEILIQGDRRRELRTLLAARAFKVKG